MILINTDYKLSIDTMKLQAKLSHEEIDSIFDYIHRGYYSNDSYKFNFHMKEIGYSMHLLPHNELWTFNARITLQTSFFKANYIPHSLIDILKTFNWSVTQLDLAYDYFAFKENSFVFKHHGNVKHQQIIDEHGHESLYIGAFNPNRKTIRQINYDRNEKEFTRGISEEGRHIYSNRYEVKLSYKMNKQLLIDIDHNLIMKHIKKFLFIRNIETLDTDGFTKRKFRIIKADYDKLKNYYTAKDRKELKKIATLHREPLETIYETHKDNLFSFLMYRQSSNTEHMTRYGAINILDNYTYKLERERSHEHIG